MRKKTARLALLAVMGLLATPGPGLAAEGLVPPLSGTPPLTSSFGEFRSGHYHGGLDYSTGGVEGQEVRAPGDGWVYRLRASGVGYGRAVYYRLEDGRTVLLAHLSRFNPEITEAIESAQDLVSRYEVDFNPPPRVPFLPGGRRPWVLGPERGRSSSPPCRDPDRRRCCRGGEPPQRGMGRE